MRLSFIGITPDTPDNGCPAVFAEEETGDLWVLGETATDPDALAEAERHSPAGALEAVWDRAVPHQEHELA